MSIPDFQTAMLPILRLLGDGHEHAKMEYQKLIADEFGITDEERRIRIPSGKQDLYENRIAWAVTHLANAGLVNRTGRGKIQITSRGLDTLRSGTTRVDMKFLLGFPEYADWRKKNHEIEARPENLAEQSATPAELIDSSYQLHRQALADELLERIRSASPKFFERLVVELLVSMGYGGSHSDAARAVGGSGDEGIDGIIKEDKLGLDFVYIQAKRWANPVSRTTVQAFSGSLDGQRARKGVLITTSSFTKDAIEYVTRIEKRIVLIDGTQLADLMIDHGVGVAEVVAYSIKRIDVDYFDE